VHKPTLFLDEVQEQLYKSTGKWVHASTICRTIKQNGFTHKKVQVIALQQSEAARLHTVHGRNISVQSWYGLMKLVLTGEIVFAVMDIHFKEWLHAHMCFALVESVYQQFQY